MVEYVAAKAEPMPASEAIDGLERMVADRHPVLDMVRHPAGEISWRRRDEQRLAQRYDEIFKRLEGE